MCHLCEVGGSLSRNVQDHDVYIWNGPRSNANMPVERSHATFCVYNIHFCTVCQRLWDILRQNVHDRHLVLLDWSRVNVNMPMERHHATFCVSNCCPICHRLPDIHSRIVHNLQTYLWNMSVKCKYSNRMDQMRFSVLEIAILVLICHR